MARDSSDTCPEKLKKACDREHIIINDDYNWLEISGQVPSSIINWNEIEVLNMSYNNLDGFVPNEICDLNLDFNDLEKFNFQGNDLCPPYPECIEDFIGTQNNFLAQLQQEKEAGLLCGRTEDGKEAIKASIEKRKAKFLVK